MANVMINTLNMPREEWLNIRKQGIGGSDAAAVAGLNRWKSPVAVYFDKTNQVQESETASEAAYWGTVMEDVVAKEFENRTGLKVRRRNAILQHPDYPFMIANVDRLIVGRKEGLECKTASEYLKSEWKDEEIPPQYLIQCQHYMSVTCYKAWWIAVLIGGNKFVYKKVDRDEEIINKLIQIEKDFWENHVQKRIPPMFDGSQASSELLKSLYPSADPDSEITLPEDAESYIEAIDQLNKEIKDLETQKKSYENQLKAMIGEHEVAYAGTRKITWKNVISNRFDSRRFSKEHRDLYQQYLKQSQYRRFVIK